MTVGSLDESICYPSYTDGTTTAGDTYYERDLLYLTSYERQLLQVEDLNNKGLQKIIAKLYEVLIPDKPNIEYSTRKLDITKGPRHPYPKEPTKKKLRENL